MGSRGGTCNRFVTRVNRVSPSRMHDNAPARQASCKPLRWP
jgi:hypothetical protein